MSEQHPDTPAATQPYPAADDDHLDSPPGMFQADAAERAATEPPAERPLTPADLRPVEEPEQPKHDPALVGPTALANILTTDPVVTIGDGETRQTVRLRFDLLALAELEKRYGTVIGPMQKLAAAATSLDSSSPTEGLGGDLIGTVLEVVTIAAGRQRIVVPDELRAGSAGAPVMAQRVKVKDQPRVFEELLADGPETFVDLLVKVTSAFTAAFGNLGGAEGKAPTASSTGSPGGTGGTSPSESSTSDPATSGA